MLEHLFPDKRKFFAEFSHLAQRVTSAAAFLAEGFEAPSRWPAVAAGIQQIDRDTDAAAHAIDLGAERTLFPPVDREDIHGLAIRLQRVMDFIGGTARRAVSLGAAERREPAVALARTLLAATEEIAAAVAHLRDGAGVIDRCRAVKRAEEQGDALWEQAMIALFTGTPDPLETLRWKTLYDQLEEALDACDDVANELETIMVKHPW